MASEEKSSDSAKMSEFMKTFFKRYLETAPDGNGTTFLSIQRFDNNISIMGSHIAPNEPFIPLFPNGIIHIDEENVKKKIISKFEELESKSSDFADLGNIMYNYFIPEPIREHFDSVKPSNLIIITPTEHDLPWEFINDGSGFWCTEYSMGRVLVEGRNIRGKVRNLSEKDIRIAIIADPTEDLTAAKNEAREIHRLLASEPNIKTDVFEGKDAKKIDVLRIFLRGNYDIIHYAGHADFNNEDPKRSCLHLSDGDLTYDEIIRLKFPEESRPVVFANACYTSKNGFVGGKTESLASAFIKAGALAYIGTMWQVEDKLAAKFATRFYTNLKQMTIGESLRSARDHIRQQIFQSNAWAPYTLFGDPTRSIISKNGRSGEN